MYVPYQFPFTGGINRTKVPCKSDPASFYTLQNFRQSIDVLGVVEQTNRFYTTTVTQGTYYTGAGSATEPTTSSIMWYGSPGNLGTLTISQYTLSTGSGQKPVLLQSAYPAGTATVFNSCLLKVVNTATMSVTLGNTYDVVIDGAATFKWRVNGGGYTALVAIDLANGNLIDGGAIRIYWLAATGFTVNDTWSWQRTDRTYFNSNLGFLNSVIIDDQLFVNWTTDGRAFVVEFDSNGNVYMRSVGYRPVICKNLTADNNHLFALGITSTGTLDGSYVWNSDLGNYDNFTPTDTNEADYIPLHLIDQSAIGGLSVYGGAVYQNRLYLLTSSGLYYSDYSGLPIPYNFKFLLPLNAQNIIGNGMIATSNGVFLYTYRSLYLFDGVQLTELISFPAIFGSSYFPNKLIYDAKTNQITVGMATTAIFNRKLLVYDATYKRFHVRITEFSATGGRGLNYASTSNIVVGTTSRRYMTEGSFGNTTPAFDDTAGTTYAVPTIITQLIGNDVTLVKEVNKLYIAPFVDTTARSAFSVSGFVQIKLSWYVSNDGLINTTALTDTNAYWTNAKSDGGIDYPRISYRYIAFQLTLIGTNGSLPPGPCSIQGLETKVLDTTTRDR